MPENDKLDTHLKHIHRRELCDDCGPAVDFALAAAREPGQQLERLRAWLGQYRPGEFDTTTDPSTITGVLTLLEREGREWPDANDCRSIEVALRLHATRLRNEAKKLRELGHPALGTNLESQADGLVERLAPQFSSQLDLPLQPAAVSETPAPPELFDGSSDEPTPPDEA